MIDDNWQEAENILMVGVQGIESRKNKFTITRKTACRNINRS